MKQQIKNGSRFSASMITDFVEHFTVHQRLCASHLEGQRRISVEFQ